MCPHAVNRPLIHSFQLLHDNPWSVKDDWVDSVDDLTKSASLDLTMYCQIVDEIDLIINQWNLAAEVFDYPSLNQPRFIFVSSGVKKLAHVKRFDLMISRVVALALSDNSLVRSGFSCGTSILNSKIYWVKYTVVCYIFFTLHMGNIPPLQYYYTVGQPSVP